MSFDVVIKNGRYFDGTGGPSAIRNLGIRDGHIAAVTEEPIEGAEEIDASGQWVMPGLIDIHTHYDIELLNGPDLSESLRHGVTTVVVGSCSISTVHVGGVDAGDLFGRVEAIPRDHVITAIGQHKNWSSAEEYIHAIEARPLGPNVTAFIGHSDMRTAVMGLERATTKDDQPADAELAQMERWLVEALDAGFIGLSSQQLLFDRLDGDVCRSRTLPSTYVKRKEMRRLTRLVRKWGRVLQSGPDIQHPPKVAAQLARSIGGLRRPLKLSFLAAADAKSNPIGHKFLTGAARLINALGGDFRWQHLPVPFEVYGDGIDLVIFEELGAGAAALHLRDQMERNELMRDESYRRQFRKEYDDKFKIGAWHRDFFDADIVSCPDGALVGKTFGQVGLDRGLHPVDAFLDLVLEHGRQLRWRTVISNHRPKVLKKLAVDPGVQVGFSDAGAHLRNMAFYNSGLCLLRHVHQSAEAGAEFMTVEHAVHRLTGELADWYSLDAGHLRIGDRADIAVIDPAHLDESLSAYAEEAVEQYGGLSRMVNRNDDTVTAVLVGGRTVFRKGVPTDLVGKVRTGSFLRAGRKIAAPTVPSAVPVGG
ncbi:N-acyl-D-amino-acid deacylase family protein [Mycolicibacterium sp. 120270]|uniref:N-acyl-D-amino-acid deacylase family protein n=1 Tax=Mycolicibacterium sp. 120270 TaxID=3090600 RepID=UPI00299D023F|nr:amidohydrolase family protein [Mycolicibacterium sp. 120270]MDX1887125.1 amidohydrolase family protein [Mycolicibacterium sp. 120270]